MSHSNKLLPQNPKPYQLFLPGTIAIVLFGIIVWGLSMVLPPAIDWQTAFRPAALKLIAGRSPYEVEGFFNPFWGLIPLIPMAVFPEQVGRAMLFVATLLSFAYIAHRFGARPLATLFILLSPPAMHGLLNGNIDWLALLGLVFPPWVGLFFVMIKPQLGLAIAIFWTIEAWRDGGWRGVVRLLWPITTVFLLSLLVFGPWPLNSAKEVDLWWNASLWPASIPVGLVLLTTALRTRKINFAMGASPCLSPYVLLHSWIIALFAIVHLLPELIMAVIGLWILVAIRFIG
jgi:hypothetical protein